jgi:dTDP-L-rhamnose 4-epimerase
MPRTALITGGAGFIGSHVADELLEQGWHVRALDLLHPQVHGPERRRPDYLADEVELIVGDVLDRDTLARAMRGVDAVVHLAASVGVGQSMYEIASYTHSNCTGTASVLEALAGRPIERLVVASSMSVYGEGLYRDSRGRLREARERGADQLERGDWDMRGDDGEPLEPLATPESKRPAPSSVYALSKLYQEELALCVGRARGTPTVALRFFNAYGPRQSLSNPYTGVLAIFASRYLNRRPPVVFEDGRQRRDFVSVHDLARACRLALESPRAPGEVFNIGSGRPRSVLEVARLLGKLLGAERLDPQIVSQYRAGDIRHCFADTTKARERLGFEAEVALEDGLEELVQWLEGRPADDRVDAAHQELAARGLVSRRPPSSGLPSNERLSRGLAS